MRALLRVQTAFLGLAIAISGVQSASAQGLIWELPEDGKSIHYSGTYKHTEERPDSSEGALTLQWDRQLWIKSVGTETARFKGQEVPCRWIEIKVVTGKPTDEGIDPGLVGARVYKVLVPEPAIRGQLLDDQQIPVAAIPIIRGFRRFGESDVKAIESGILQVYPLITFIPHLRAMDQAEGTVDPQVQLGAIEAVQFSGLEKVESRTTRTTTEVTLWRSKDVPFGLAKWEITVRRERKDINDPRTEFKAASSIEIKMQADRVDEQAESELATPGAE